MTRAPHGPDDWIDDWLDESITVTRSGSARDPLARPEKVRVLHELPTPSTVYRNALARSARAALLASNPLPPTLPDVALRVGGIRLDGERLDTYRRLVGEGAAGPSGDVAPPGFVHVVMFGLQLALMAREDFPLPMLGMVHTANRIEQLRGVTPQDVLEATTWARSLTARPVGRDAVGTQVELVTEVRAVGATRRDGEGAGEGATPSGAGAAEGATPSGEGAGEGATPSGEIVWQGVSTYLAKSVTLRDLPLLERPARAPFTPPLPTGGWSTSAATTNAYAAVSGDRNPIHVSTLAAKAFGFPRRIAHGMDTAARALAVLGPERGERFTWRVDFGAPVLVPGRVALRVERRGDLEETSQARRSGWEMTVWDPERGRAHVESTLAHA